MIYTAGISLTLFPEMKYLENLKNPVILDAVFDYQELKTIRVYKYNPTPKNPNFSAGGNVWHIRASATLYF